MIYLTLYYEFFKIGLFAVGGGLATLPFLYDLADKYTWFDSSVLPNMIAISESTPGPIGINMATYAGHSISGVLGGIIATLGLITPSIIIIMLVANFLNKFKENFYVQSAFYGLRPSVAALIALAAFEVLKVSIFTFDKFIASHNIINLIDIRSTILFAIFMLATNRFKIHPIFYIAIGAVLGIVLKI